MTEPNARIKIVWWNVEDGITDRQLGQGDLLKGIREFSEVFDTDILILGEYGQDSGIIDENTMAELKRKYSVQLIPYSPYCGKFGFLILSKIPFNLKLKERLGWEAGSDASPRARSRFAKRWLGQPNLLASFERSFVHLEFSTSPTKVISIVPVHVIQPWIRLLKTSLPVLSCMQLCYSYFFGKNNPIYWQSLDLMSKIKQAQLGPGLVLGDFNIGGRFMGLRPPAYAIFADSLKDLVRSAGPSFPAKGSKYYVGALGLRIDHAFGTEDIEATRAKVLPILGSDHYPLFLELKIKGST